MVKVTCAEAQVDLQIENKLLSAALALFLRAVGDLRTNIHMLSKRNLEAVHILRGFTFRLLWDANMVTAI